MRQARAGHRVPFDIDRDIDAAGEDVGEARRHQFGEVAFARDLEALRVAAGDEPDIAGKSRRAVRGQRNRAGQAAAGQRGLRDQPVARSRVTAHQADEDAVGRLLDRHVERDRRGAVGAIDRGRDGAGFAVDTIGLQISLDAAIGADREVAGDRKRGGAADQRFAELQPCDVEVPDGDGKQPAATAAGAGALQYRGADDRDPIGADRSDTDGAGQQGPDIDVDRQSVDLGEGSAAIGQDDLVGAEGEGRPAGQRADRQGQPVAGYRPLDNAGEHGTAGRRRQQDEQQGDQGDQSQNRKACIAKRTPHVSCRFPSSRPANQKA